MLRAAQRATPCQHGGIASGPDCVANLIRAKTTLLGTAYVLIYFGSAHRADDLFRKLPLSETLVLDPSDIRILRILQEDASLSIAEVALRAGMSQTPCWRRIKRLKETGVIRGMTALIDRKRVGLDFASYTFVKLVLPSSDNMQQFDQMVNRWPEVILCERITGAADYVLKVIVDDMKSYDDFLRMKLLATNLISEVQSSIVISSVKDTTILPLRDA
jgi:Lrp/AsnC family transcriptional regulator